MGQMVGFGRVLVVSGALLMVAGLVALLLSRLGLPTRLPGDFVFRRGSMTVFLPVATSLLLSLLLSLFLNLIVRRR